MGKKHTKKTRKKENKKIILFKTKKFIIGFSFAVFLLIASVIVKSPNPGTCANSISCIKDLSGKYEQGSAYAEFLGKNIYVPKYLANDTFSTTKVLGTTAGEKRIEINLSIQRLYAYEGNSLIYEFPVSTGKWGLTPTGTFYTWIKLRYTRMQGGNKALGTYYNLPNVPYTMYFHNESIPKYRGFGIHGAYWHNNFGHPMSHGCVNMRIEDSGKLYSWADPPTQNNVAYVDQNNPGTKIVIYGETPKE